MLRQLNQLLFVGYSMESQLEYYLQCFWLLQFLAKGVLNNLETKTYLHKLTENCCFLDFFFMHSLQEVLLIGFDVSLSSINEK